jgi:hypothetical protein
MKSNRKNVTNPETPVRRSRKTARARADVEAPIWALLPSAAEVRRTVVRPAHETSFRSSDKALAGALDIPPALLNPLASLPRPIALDEVQPLRAPVVARKTQKR